MKLTGTKNKGCPFKSKANLFKHKVSFEEAETVFDDKYAVTLFDELNSIDEDRFVIIGESADFRELFVCHCFRGNNDEIIRIISARKAQKSEIDIYYRR
jgi:uncharacterized DUF497 family protein